MSEIMDRIRHADTLTNRHDTPEGKMAVKIEKILFRRSINNTLLGYTLVTSQEIVSAILEGDDDVSKKARESLQ